MHLVSKTETFVKLFFVLSLFGLVMYVVLAFFTLRTAFSSIKKIEKIEKHKHNTPNPFIDNDYNGDDQFLNNYRYILLWTRPDIKVNFTRVGSGIFVENDCEYTSCYITSNKMLLNNDVTNFDAILFNLQTLSKWKRNMPIKRSPKQKYVFYSMNSAADWPICDINSDNFFNWTWTYRLTSDIKSPFIEVRDLSGVVVAPAYTAQWFGNTMLDTFAKTYKTHITKKKAVMWYNNRCKDSPQIIFFIKRLRDAMTEHSLTVDIYDCNSKCPENNCFSLLEREYFFYLAHETSIAEDYVTAEVLKAYDHNTVPIVVGGAEYTRFLPPGSYLNTQKHSMELIAANIAYAIKTPSVYYKFFLWKQYYTIEAVPRERGYCDLCKILNDKSELETKTIYRDFRKWWFPGVLKEKCLTKGAERFEEVLSYSNARMSEKDKNRYYGFT